MMLVDTRANAVVLRRVSSGVLNVAHTILGTIPGVNVTFAAAANGPGIGRLRSEADGITLHWTPPGETIEGPPVVCASDGEYLLEGPDSAKWLRINVTAAFLLANASEARVHLAGRFLAGMTISDVFVLGGGPGLGLTHSAELVNNSAKRVFGARVWLDPATTHMKVEDGVGGFYQPTTEAAGFEIGDITPGGTAPFLYQSAVAGGAASDPKVLNRMLFSYRTW